MLSVRRPRRASSSATAAPITPAPMITASYRSAMPPPVHLGASLARPVGSVESWTSASTGVLGLRIFCCHEHRPKEVPGNVARLESDQLALQLLGLNQASIKVYSGCANDAQYKAQLASV